MARSTRLTHDELVLALYQDLAAGRGLEPSLHAIARHFGAINAHLLASDAHSFVPLWGASADLTGGALAASMQAYTQHHWRNDPRRAGIARILPGTVHNCDAQLGPGEVSRSEFFQDFFLPTGLRWSMVGRLAPAPDSSPGSPEVVDLALVRALGAQPFDADAHAGLQRLLPHLRSALVLGRSLAAAEAQQSAQATLGDKGLATLCLDAKLRLVDGSASALQHLVLHAGQLRLRMGEGMGTVNRPQPQLDALVRAVLADGQARRLVLVTGAQPPDRLVVHALRRPGPGGEPQVLLLLRWPLRKRLPTTGDLRQFFGLSPREAELGLALLQGRSPREVWESTGLSAATVRSRLRALYAKTGSRGQADFVRQATLLAGEPGP